MYLNRKVRTETSACAASGAFLFIPKERIEEPSRIKLITHGKTFYRAELNTVNTALACFLIYDNICHVRDPPFIPDGVRL